MFHHLFCLGRFIVLADYPEQVFLETPARKWLTPVVDQPLSQDELVNVCAGQVAVSAATIGGWLEQNGIDYDEEGYLEFDIDRLTIPGKRFVDLLCRQLGCEVIDCLGHICTRRFVTPTG